MPDAKRVFAHKDFCFCPKGKNNECFKYGVLSMAPCRDSTYFTVFAYYLKAFKFCVMLIFPFWETLDAPIALSGAHFLDSYEKYQNMVIGLKPEKNKHETVLDIEPVCVILVIYNMTNVSIRNMCCIY